MIAFSNPLKVITGDAAATPKKLRKDLRVLASFISLYCRFRHPSATKTPAALKFVDVEAVFGRPLPLCPACTKLLAHALFKRMRCPLDPKPACKHCPQHCYAPTYRAEIREVMRYSSRKLLLSGRLHYLVRVLF